MVQFASTMVRQVEVSFRRYAPHLKMVDLRKEVKNSQFNCQSQQFVLDLEEIVVGSSLPALLMRPFAIGMFRPANAYQQSTREVINKCSRVTIDKTAKYSQREEKTNVLGSMMSQGCLHHQE